MNAPNKIYLQVCGHCSIETCENCEFANSPLNEVTWSEDRIFEKDVEYIRKEALLEYLGNRRAELTEWANRCHDLASQVALNEVLGMINKLKDI